MVLPVPRWTIRNILLVIFVAVWSTVVLTNNFRGERPSADDWAALGIGLAAIVALFRNGSPPDQGGGSPS